MNNLIFNKLWESDGLISLNILAKSKYVQSFTEIYISKDCLMDSIKKIQQYLEKPKDICVIEMSKRSWEFTPYFKMVFLPIDQLGHIKIEIDMEINDIKDKSHNCCFFIEATLGSIDNLVDSMGNLVKENVECIAYLYEE